MASVVALFTAVYVHADMFGFDTVTTNSPFREAVADQLFMDTSSLGAGFSSVMFTNTGPLPSTVTEIYFGSDMALNLQLDAIISHTDPGVDFTITGASPQNPPGWGGFGSWWTVTIAAAEATSPPAQNGIDPLEYLTLQVSYDGTSTFSQLIQFGQLQVAMHVTSLPDGNSDTFVNTTEIVPEPASLVLIGSAGALLALVRRRFNA